MGVMSRNESKATGYRLSELEIYDFLSSECLVLQTHSHWSATLLIEHEKKMDAFVSVELEAKWAQPAKNGEKICNGSQLELGEPGLRLEGAGLMSGFH